MVDAVAEAVIRRDGFVYLYQSDAAFDNARSGFKLRRHCGVDMRLISGDEAHELEPEVAPIRHGAFFPSALVTTDPRSSSACFRPTFFAFLSP